MKLSLAILVVLPARSLSFIPLPVSTRASSTTPFSLASYWNEELNEYVPRGDSFQTASVVITGGGGGVGYAYADELLSQGHRVVIADITPPEAPLLALKKKHGENAPIFGIKTDVSSWDDVCALGDFAVESLGSITHWINNAGINGGRRELLSVPPQEVERVVKVNLLGKIYCSKKAIEVLEKQTGVTSHLFNTVGSGVKGGGTPGYACYGATKRGLPQFTDSLRKEIDEGVEGYEKRKVGGKVCVHTLSPGMVFTKLLLEDSTPELRKFPFGILAAQPEEVAEDLVPKILAADKSGSSVEFLDTDKILTKFFQRFVLQKKSKYIDDSGNVIRLPGEQYDEDGVKALF